MSPDVHLQPYTNGVDRRMLRETIHEEIERKFLVATDGYRKLAKPVRLRQGYLAATKSRTVRVRAAGDKGYLTIKDGTDGLRRTEFEYEIPLQGAERMLAALCEQPLIEKDRYTMRVNGHIWHVDEFHGENEGLIVAEVHLDSPEQTVALPDWVGQEVSGDPRYFNSNLVRNPYRKW